MKKRVLSLMLVLALCASLLAACGSNEGKNNVSEKVYTFYSDTHYPPFGYLDTETNTYVGFDYDVLAAIAENQNFSYKVENVGFDAAMGAVQAGQCDAMIAAMTITDARKEIYDFSDGYYETGLLCLTSSENGIDKIEDIEGKVLATKIGTLGTAYAEGVAKTYGAEIAYYEDTPTMFNAIIQGNAIAGYEDGPQVLWAIKSGENLKVVGDVIDPGAYGIAVKKGENAELLEMINKGLANIKANGKYDEILAKWGL